MKKLFIILITTLLHFNTYSQIKVDSTVFDIYNSYFAQTFAGSQHCSSYRQCVPAGTYAQTIFGYEWRGVTGNPGAAYLDKNPLTLSGIYYPDHGWKKEQDSFTIKYLFQKGYKYRIVMKCNFGDGDPNYGPHPPALQLQLTNTPDYTYGRDCYVDTTPIPAYDLMTNSSNPALQFNGDNTIVGPQTPEFIFTPGIDYSHVWINSRTTTAFENYGNIYIYKIVIYKSLDVSISGPDNFCNGTNTVYKVNQGSNLYSGAVTWSTTGNVNIVGSSTGNSVTVTNNPSSFSQYGDLTATLQNAVLTKNIAVGLQTLTVSNVVDRSDQSSHYQYLTATAQQIPGTVPGNYK